MAAVTAAVLGAASLGYGIYSKLESNKKSEEASKFQQQGALIQAQAAGAMHDISVAQAETSAQFAEREYGLNKQSASDSLVASQQSQVINRQITSLSREVEGQRRVAMEIEGRRKSLEMIRTQQRARAMALATATAQGSQRGSGLQGGYGQISGQTNTNLMGVQQNLQVGRSIFDLNDQITGQKIQMSNLEDIYALQRFNSQNQKAQISYDYAKINAHYQTRLADAQQLMSQGGGVVNQGSGMMSLAQGQASTAGMFINAAGTIAGMGKNANELYKNYFTPGTNPVDVGSATGFSFTPSGMGGIGHA